MKHKKAAVGLLAVILIATIAMTLNKGDLSTISDTEVLGKKLGFISMIPTILAVLMSFVTSNVLFALLVGFLSGVLILAITASNTFETFLPAFLSQFWTDFSNVFFDSEKIKIAVLCLTVGGMVEVVRLSGGFEALALKLTKKIDTPRKCGLIGSLMGCIIFFDDYANALIVGPVMRSIGDKIRVSREKIAYIVDSTAAPVTGIAIVSSWVAVEVGAINNGLEIVGSDIRGFALFLSSIPYTFYCLFCILIVFVNSMTQRDFGPMLKAERRARRGSTVSDEAKKMGLEKTSIVTDKQNKRIFVGVGSILLLVILSITLFYLTGKTAAIADGELAGNAPFSLNTVITAFGYADTMLLVTIGALAGTLFAIIFGCNYGLFTWKESCTAFLKGAKDLLETVFLLFLAWCLADTINYLGTTYYAVEIISASVSWKLVPLLIFLACCVISFAAGSYGCFFVVMPLAIPLAFRMLELGVGIDPSVFLSVCVGSVMGGSIFGDHCSPVTDCTILSSIGSGCTTMEHVFTQLPYAIITAIISAMAVTATVFGMNLLLIFIAAIAIQIAVFMVLGKDAEK